MVFILLGSVLFSVLVRGEIILTGSGVVFPKAVGGNEPVVSYSDILHVREETRKKQRIATIVTKRGKQYSVDSYCLDSEAEYRQFLTALASNIKNNRDKIG